MMFDDWASDRDKLSPELAARLTHLQPQQKVIVLLQVQEAEKHLGKRPSPGECQATIRAVRVD